MANVYVAKNGMDLDLSYKPSIITNSKGEEVNCMEIPENEWHKYRTLGFGGSDAGVLMGSSHFTSKREIIALKTGDMVADTEDKDNQFILDWGHALEDTIIKEFQRRNPSVNVLTDNRMFRHPIYPFMIADVDGFVQIRDANGKLRNYILEIKTTCYNNKDAWGKDGVNEMIPDAYQWQGRHYCAVMNASGVIFVCCYDREIVVRVLNRDLDLEAELIKTEENYWNNYVLKKKLPPLEESGSVAMDYINKTLIPSATGKKVFLGSEKLNDSETTIAEELNNFFTINAKRQELSKAARALDAEAKGCLARIELVTKAEAGEVLMPDGSYIALNYKKTCRSNLSKKAEEELKLSDPDFYNKLQEYKEYTETLTLTPKVIKTK